MKLLRKWLGLKYRIRARRWRERAMKAEAELVSLKLQMIAETWRNRAREDTFASAAVLGSRNMFGIAARSGPAQVERKPQSQPVDPYQLSGADLMEFETFWKPDAEAAGIGLTQAKQEFIKQVVLPRRQPLNDDPFNQAN